MIYKLKDLFLKNVYYSPPIVQLGRWCHPSSDQYKKCDQMKKMILANRDNCFMPQTRKTTFECK